MLCDRAQEVLSAYLDLELPSHESLPLEKHLRGCPACSGRLAELHEVRALLSSLEEVVPPEGFHASLHRRLVAAQAASAPAPAASGRAAAVVPLAPVVRHVPRWSANRWVAAVAAVAVMAVSAGSYYLQTLRPVVPPNLVAQYTPGDVPGPTDSGRPTSGGIGPVITPEPKPGPGPSVVSPAPHTDTGNPELTTKPATGGDTAPNSGTAPQDSGVKPPAPNPPDNVGVAAQPGENGGSAMKPSSVTPPPPSDAQGPLLVYQVDIQIEASSTDATERLVIASQDLGGTFKSVGTSRLDNGTPIAMYEIRVPAAKYQEAKSRILAIGPALSTNEVGPRDVISQVNSLRQQIDSLLGQEKQLAASDQLKSIEAQIEEKQSELAQYYDQARMATLRVTVVQTQS
ncbi:MAG: DUF4349 domain-containing protein [Firmicutes bacterium]|nr:DUF4349 domain-containing protein [Bacillota bacterium]